ncbi:hypothetical protein [Streptomyces sp. NPDC012616]|uniref:hypothetical protein n=1 Tax=Streptomyces sp. NPDC012616 TaxID=3364840 RepID=UPI0036E76021
MRSTPLVFAVLCTTVLSTYIPCRGARAPLTDCAHLSDGTATVAAFVSGFFTGRRP